MKRFMVPRVAHCCGGKRFSPAGSIAFLQNLPGVFYLKTPNVPNAQQIFILQTIIRISLPQSLFLIFEERNLSLFSYYWNIPFRYLRIVRIRDSAGLSMKKPRARTLSAMLCVVAYPYEDELLPDDNLLPFGAEELFTILLHMK